MCIFIRIGRHVNQEEKITVLELKVKVTGDFFFVREDTSFCVSMITRFYDGITSSGVAPLTQKRK